MNWQCSVQLVYHMAYVKYNCLFTKHFTNKLFLPFHWFCVEWLCCFGTKDIFAEMFAHWHMVPHHLGFTFSHNLFCVLKQPSSHKCSRSCSLLWNGLYAFAMAGRWLARPTPITRKHTCFITHNPYKPSHRHSILIASCSTKDQVEKIIKVRICQHTACPS